jgi:hypothetical protein
MTGSTLTTNQITDRRDTLTALWRFCTSRPWAALLLALLALTAAVVAAWPQLGQVTPPGVVSTGGLPSFSFYPSLWLRLLLALIAFTLILRLADRLEVARHLASHLQRARTLYAHESNGDGSLPRPAEPLSDSNVREIVKAFPGGRLYRVWQTTEANCDVTYVERLRFAIWGDVALHLGCLVIIAGLFVSGQWGWHESGIALARGETQSITHAPGYDLTLLQSTPATARGHESRLSLSLPKGGSRLGSVAAAVPWLAWPLAIFQIDSGPALRLAISSVEGKPLQLQPLAQKSPPSESVALKFAGPQDDASVAVPALSLTVRIDRYASLPEEGYWMPVFLIQAYQGSQSTPLFSRYVWADQTYTWQGNEYKMTLEDYVIFAAASDPGWVVVAVGLVLLIGGGVLRKRPVPLLVRIAAPLGDSPCAIEVAGCGDRSAADDFVRRMGATQS